MGHSAPAEDLTLTLVIHAGILSFIAWFLSSQFVLSSSGHVCQLSLKGWLSGGQGEDSFWFRGQRISASICKGLLTNKIVNQYLMHGSIYKNFLINMKGNMYFGKLCKVFGINKILNICFIVYFENKCFKWRYFL